MAFNQIKKEVYLFMRTNEGKKAILDDHKDNGIAVK